MNDSAWTETLNPSLVQKLTNRIVQPGVSRMSLSQAIVSRIDNTTTGLPLAQAVRQRWSSSSAWSGEVPPVVYAQPAPLATDPASIFRSGGTNTSGAQGGIGSSIQRTPQAIVQPRRAEVRTTTSPSVPGSPTVPGASQSYQQPPASPLAGSPSSITGQVIQRSPLDVPKITKVPAPGVEVAAKPKPNSAGLPANPGQTGRSSGPPTTPGNVVQRSPKRQKSLDPERVNGPAAKPHLVQAKPGSVRPETAVRPAVRPVQQPVRRRPDSPQPTLPVVRETVTVRSDSRPGSPAVGVRTGVVQRTPASNGGARSGLPLMHPARSHNNSVIQRQPETIIQPASGSPHQEPAPQVIQSGADIETLLEDDVMEKMQRGFMRRMAIESERRGVTSWP